jgi:hypothetical protein
MAFRSSRQGAWFAAGLLLGAGLWLGLRHGAGRISEAAPPVRAATSRASRAWTPPGKGFVVWESNRTGRWRLWAQRLDGSGLRQLTPDEGERIHCCPHVSPDGIRIAYLSLEPGPDRYPEKRPETGALRLIRPDGAGQRTLAPAARAYGEHRAAVWHGADRLVFIDGEGYTVRLTLASGKLERLTLRPHSTSGWLLSPALTHATDGLPTFSLYDGRRRAVTELQAFGGCQPYFTPDGRQGYWIAGAGGPVYGIDLGSREVFEILGKFDPRLPGPQGYLYFPMLSPDRRLLAFGASDGGHDHWRADYDIHIAEVHPESLRLVGPPARVAPHQAVDRFPAVWLDPKGARPVPPRPPDAPRKARATGSAWPSGRDGLVFLWEAANAANRAFDPVRGVQRSFPVERRGRARLDHWHRMDLAGGAFAASGEASEAIVAGVQRANELTIEATLTPRTATQAASIVALSGGGERVNAVLAQEGNRLVLRLALARRGVARSDLDLGALEAGRPTHVLVSYRPGRLTAWRDGQSVVDTDEVQGDFFRWRPRPLAFGPWNGWLEGIAIYGRALEADEAAENARLVKAKLQRRAAVPAVRLRGRLVARSRIPTLREISPYREALAVYEYRVEKVLEGRFPAPRVRVAHWVILDGGTLPPAGRREGEVYELRLEPFAANPQLESIFLSESLPGASAGDLFYDAAPPDN